MLNFGKALSLVAHRVAFFGAGSCLIVIVALTVASVVGRYFFKIDAVPGAFNMIESILFPSLVFMALPLAHSEGIFPRLNIFDDRFSDSIDMMLKALVAVVEIFVYLVLLWFVWKFSMQGLSSGRSVQVGVGYFPVWPIAFTAVWAFTMMIAQMSLNLSNIFKSQ